MLTYPTPTMPRSTAHLEEQFARRRVQLAAEWLQLESVRRFVASHDPGRDAYVDESVTPPVVRWTNGPDGSAIATTMAEARAELGY